MAKNLKLNVKNTQLAEALKLSHLKKAPAKKKKAEETEEQAQEPQQASQASQTSQAPSVPLEATPVEKALGTTFETPPPAIKEQSPIPEKRKEVEAQEERRTPAREEPPAAPRASEAATTTPNYTPPYQRSYPPRQDAERRPYTPREGAGERRPYTPRPDGERRPYTPREGGSYPPRTDRPYTPRPDGERKPYTPREGGSYPPRTDRPYTPRPDGERRPYTPREGGSYPPRTDRPYTPRPDGERRPYTPREGGSYPPRTDRPYTPRPDGERRPYTPREGGSYPPRTDRPYTPRPDGERRPYTPREGGSYTPRTDRPYTPRTDGGVRRPYSPRPEGHPEFKRAFPSKTDGEFKKTSKEGFSPSKKTGKIGQRDEENRDFKAQKKAVDATRSFDSRDRQGLRAESEDQMWRKKRAQKQRVVVQEEIIRPKNLSVRLPISIKDLAAEMKLKSSQLITNLFMKGVVLTLNDFLDDPTTVQLLGHDFDCDIQIDTSEEERVRITDKTIKQEIQESPPETLIIRPPVIAFMGHVDHGKTSLIDAIRKTNLAGDEAGAITQHIGAFKSHTNAGDITILDTPGHEAFSAMRTRGADVTDIVVLVIAGDEGMRAQTIEALQQAQNAQVPIVVALNKSDKPGFDPEIVYRQLAEHQLLPEAWGGQTITINCSATTGAGINNLVEMLALQAEVLELKANPRSRARGTVIESEMHKGLGPVATVLVQNGTLRLGDALVFSQNYARVKTMHDELGKELIEAGPSTPVKITGLSGLPEAGSEFIVVKDEKDARELAEKRIEGKRFQMMQQPKRATTESFTQDTQRKTPKKILNLIVRADVQGSVEALKNSLSKLPTDKVELNIISAAVGEISESDVELAETSKAIVIGFHTQIESHASSLIKELKVTVKLHDIIYHAVDDVKSIMTSLLDKLVQENDTGQALVQATFKASQLGVIAGCIVTEGSIRRSAHIRVMRGEEMVWKGPIASLKKVKEDAREVSKGIECGILLHNYNDVKVGDVLQAYEINYLKQEL